ncbi:MAG: hypothetical protein ABR907_12445 [Terracidiphilus sp.]|jgi:hypothetical protein
MRIDSSLVNNNAQNPYCAATEMAIAARRPMQDRKKPMKRGAAAQGWAGSKQAFMIGQWMNGGRGEARPNTRIALSE